MRSYLPGELAGMLGVSADTVRRWIDTGRISSHRTNAGHRVVDGSDLAHFLEEWGTHPEPDPVVAQSARNRFPGIVTRVLKDGIMAQVEIRSGPYRIVSLISREAADELGLVPGTSAVAAVKSTNVVVELTGAR